MQICLISLIFFLISNLQPGSMVVIQFLLDCYLWFTVYSLDFLNKVHSPPIFSGQMVMIRPLKPILISFSSLSFISVHHSILSGTFPPGLGKTVPELGDLSGIPVIPKTAFTMYTDEVAEVLELGTKIDGVWLCGVETHVCVQATALDLIERGAQVHCIVDACSSRNMVDR